MNKARTEQVARAVAGVLGDDMEDYDTKQVLSHLFSGCSSYLVSEVYLSDMNVARRFLEWTIGFHEQLLGDDPKDIEVTVWIAIYKVLHVPTRGVPTKIGMPKLLTDTAPAIEALCVAAGLVPSDPEETKTND
jgi:hypothetical protein